MTSRQRSLEKRPRRFDSCAKPIPRQRFRKCCDPRQTDRLAAREAIRCDHVKGPLANVTVIGALVHDRMVHEDVKISEAARVRNPISALETDRRVLIALA
jgi:hypothetical protein